MRLTVIAACCAALSLGACVSSPAALVEGVRALNDGCDRQVEAMMTFASPMPPSGTVKIVKTCRAARSAEAVDPAGEAAQIPAEGSP